MQHTSIEDKLNALFREPSRHRKLVLWYDDQGSFADDMVSLHLERAEIICLNGHNAISSKRRILREQKDTNFLIYAPFPKPAADDETNHFLDISFYATPFYADALYDLCEAYEIPKDLKPILAEEGAFWQRENNAKKVQALGLAAYTEETLRRAVMAVLCRVKSIQIDEIMRAILRIRQFGSDENRFLQAFQKARVLDAFWQDVSQTYGYVWAADGQPSLTEFMLHCVYSYWTQTVGDLPAAWRPSCQPNTAAAVFLANVMAHQSERPWVDDILARIGAHLDIAKIIKTKEMAPFFQCDLFPAIDEACIRQFSLLLTTSPRDFSTQELGCIQFRETTAHYAVTYSSYYKAIEYAQKLGQAIRECEADWHVTTTGEEMMQAYMSAWCDVDWYYRKFYAHYDQVERLELLGDLQQAVEQAYVHRYVEPLSQKWGQELRSYTGYADLPGQKQETFFDWYVRPKKDMVAVIISDALRYECGKELATRMADDPNMTPKLDGMVANVPTYTQLGMASLLPHQELTIEVKNTLAQADCDGASTVGAARREAILRRAEPAAKVMKLDDILQASRQSLRQELNGVRLLYVYHDAIDSTGDSAKTEDKVFAAATQGMEEILRCIRKLAVDKSIVHFLVTADHGFLYRRSSIPVYTKVQAQRQDGELYRNKRYILSAQPLQQSGVIAWPLTHLQRQEYVNIPVGCDIFSVPGGGQHFVHGGLTLQELIVPVITLKYTKYKVMTNKVSVKWYSPQARLTASHNYLKFIQEEYVTDTQLPRTVQVCIEDAEGHLLSNEVTIIADRTTTNAADRIYTEKLMLPERSYANVPAFLVIRDADEGTEVGRYDIQLDILAKTWSL